MKKTTVLTLVASAALCALTMPDVRAQNNPLGGAASGTNLTPAGGRGFPGGGFGGGGRGGRGGPPVPVISTNAPGMPDIPMPDPAVGRKSKWPIQDAANTTPPGLTARAPGDNGFYKRDAEGNQVLGTDLYRWALSGHFTSYDLEDIPPYKLPDPLVMQDGRPVTSAKMWEKERRPEIMNLFKDYIYGRVPEDKLPPIIWEVRQNLHTNGTITKTVIGYFKGTTPPTNVPIGGGGRGGFGGGFGGGGLGVGPAGTNAPGGRGGFAVTASGGFGAGAGGFAGAPGGTNGAGGTNGFARRGGRGGRGGFGGGGFGGGGGNYITLTLNLPDTGHPVPIFSGGPVNDPMGHGWGTFSVSGNAGVVARITPTNGAPKPGNFPGNYAVTGWAFSRAIDYLVKDKDVDASHITIAGISTGGKQVLYTAAMDDRIWCVVPESSGAMGVKLSRRDIGETVDDLATQPQFAGNYCPNFTNFVGHWNDMPVDQHEMIALMAPRKMFITGGNEEVWEDVKGGFAAAIAAEPVYNLLGKKGVNTIEMPPIEHPIVFGEIGYYQHNGAHTFTPNERIWITAWMEKLLPKTPAK